jgi:hypothetical protein
MGNFRAAGGAWALALLLVPPAPAQDPAPKKPPTDVERVLARLNEHRKIAGLDPVVEDKELSKGCQLHAEYVSLNDGKDELEDGGLHREAKHLPGYTDAGDSAAPRSVIWVVRHMSGVERNVDALVATLYHRIPLLAPRLAKVGIGVSLHRKMGTTVVIDVGSKSSTLGPVTYPVLYPSPSQINIAVSYALGDAEWPDPRPVKSSKCGFPVTVICDDLSWQPGGATASFTSDGKEVPSWVFNRENPAVKEMPAQEVVCILPKEPLKPKTKYTVTVKCKKYGVEKTPEWSKTWSFTTAANDEAGGEIKKAE